MTELVRKTRNGPVRGRMGTAGAPFGTAYVTDSDPAAAKCVFDATIKMEGIQIAAIRTPMNFGMSET